MKSNPPLSFHFSKNNLILLLGLNISESPVSTHFKAPPNHPIKRTKIMKKGYVNLIKTLPFLGLFHSL